MGRMGHHADGIRHDHGHACVCGRSRLHMTLSWAFEEAFGDQIIAARKRIPRLSWTRGLDTATAPFAISTCIRRVHAPSIESRTCRFRRPIQGPNARRRPATPSIIVSQRAEHIPLPVFCPSLETVVPDVGVDQTTPHGEPTRLTNGVRSRDGETRLKRVGL